MAGEHACAVEGCTKMVKADYLMCVAHWRGLPIEQQRKVNATWRNVRREPEAYREAREAAVAFWVGRAPAYGRQGSLL